MVRKYPCRWPGAEVRSVLKSSCKVEDLRLETWDRLEKAVRVDVAVAARMVSARDLAQEAPEVPAVEVLSEPEIEVSLSLWERDEAIGTDDRPGGAVIGRLGGHLNRKRNGMPRA